MGSEIPMEDGVALEPIAICGMSCRLPGQVNSPAALWDMLVNKRAGNTTKIPASRFNIDAHYHENASRPGSFNVPGGYFLDGSAHNFDPTFFHMTPIEAMWLDPLQRKMLEVCYEAIESAGLSLDKVAGSNTGVYAASFTADYQQMTMKDPDFRHNYAATGVDTGIISARIGNIFDFRGPSSLINTACSSSVYAVHNACHALRARDCDAALVGGVNMILTVDQHMNTAKLGIMSPTSFCHTFDARADGYGRAEGAGALYLKRLEDAVRDGDTVRAVIRSSAVNSNGKVPGYGITFPNADGQEQVIRQAYKRAGLDPDKTAYFEVHGTGTPVGDPIEARAVARAMNDTRSTEAPLILGAIKPNIGHSEAASGIFAIIKAALMVEKGLIPGVAGLETLNPNIHETEWNVQINRDLRSWPTAFASRRASLSSFGYGGTNAHVIIENVEALIPGYQRGQCRNAAMYDHTASRPLLVTVSAHDQTTLGRNIDAYARVIGDYYLHDFVHTLATKRTPFPAKGFAIVSEQTAKQDLSLGNFKLGSSPSRLSSKLVFVFTGQGAQWATVGREALKAFPAFRSTIKRLDLVLRTVGHTPPAYYLEEELAAPAESSNIGDPSVAQSTLAAIQIAVTDLLASWGIQPAAVIGHSSGEVGAAYAAGLVSAPEAIVAAYYRGYALAHHAPSGGSMLAVGRGVQDMEAPYYREKLGANIVVACENSPKSVTLSGPAQEIRAAREVFEAEGIFARELKTGGMAYHSPCMQLAAGPMRSYITEALSKLDSLDRLWRYSDRDRVMVSTVSNKRLTRADISAEYWTSNLVSPVRFNTAFPALVHLLGVENLASVVEIGPHSALAGPLKQICQEHGFDSFHYIPTIERNDGNAAASLLKTAGELWLAGYSIDLAQVNKMQQKKDSLVLDAGDLGPKQHVGGTPLALVDLPPYQWNYERLYWAEPRASAEYRQMTHPRHDILGRRILGLSDNSISWRNVLRIKDAPWLADHRLGGSFMFPAAGHLALAIEAVRQRSELRGDSLDVTGAVLQDVELKAALVIPDTEDGIEIQVRLTEQNRASADSPVYDFAVQSVTEQGVWTVHSSGVIVPKTRSNGPCSLPSHPVDLAALTQRHSSRTWNEAFQRVGFEYNRSFAAMDKIRTHGKYEHQAAGKIPLIETSGLVQGESRYLVHPATFDLLLQLVIIAIHGGKHREMPWGIIPVRFDEVTLMLPGEKAQAAPGDAVAWLPVPRKGSRHFVSDALLTDCTGQAVVVIRGIHTVAYEAALPPVHKSASFGPMPYAGVTWLADPTLCTVEQLFSSTHWQSRTAREAAVWLVQLLGHKKPLPSLLVVDTKSGLDLASIQKSISSTTIVTLATSDSTRYHENTHTTTELGFELLTLPQGPVDLGALQIDNQSLIVVNYEDAENMISHDALALKRLLAEHGKAILIVSNKSLVSAQEALRKSGLTSTVENGARLVDMAILFCSNGRVQDVSEPDGHTNGHTNGYTNGHVNGLKVGDKADLVVDLVYSPAHSDSPDDLANAFKGRGLKVRIQELKDFDVRGKGSSHILLYNPNGNLLAPAEPETFDSLKAIVSSGAHVVWLTSGSNQGSCPTAALVAGFLRVVRQEETAADVVLLDYDQEETPDSVASFLVARIVDPAAGADEAGEYEYWLHNGLAHVSRIVPNTCINRRMVGESITGTVAAIPERKAFHGTLDTGRIHFRPTNAVPGSSLSPDEVEIQVHTLELRRTDLHSPSSEPRLVSGIVVGAGHSALELVGKAVITFTTEFCATVIRADKAAIVEHASSRDPRHLGLLPIFCRAIDALQCRLDSLAGKQVLLLASPGSQLPQVFDFLSQAHGFVLKVAVDGDLSDAAAFSAGDIRQAVPDGDSSLVVVCEAFSSTAQDIWRNVPAKSSLVIAEAVSGTFTTAPDARPFTRGASLVVSSINQAMSTGSSALAKLLSLAIVQVDRYLGDGGGGLSDEWTTVTANTIDKFAQSHSESAVLSFQYGVDQVLLDPSPFHIEFSPEAVYLLVGCLGGLGRSLTSWMMEHGARRFAFLSRSGADKPEAARLMTSITDAGAYAQVIRGDVANEAEVKKALEAILAETPRVAGVVHAAMVLNDSLLSNMTPQKWNATLAPKVDGAKALGEALRASGIDDQLDFFVLTSSISATVGLAGASNYSAANAFLDNFTWSRNRAGLKATSLALPMVLGVGVIAENDSLENGIRRMGLYGADETEMLRGFEAAMSQPGPVKPSAVAGHAEDATPLPTQADAAIILGFEPSRIGASLAQAARKNVSESEQSWLEDRRFSSVRALAQAASAGDAADKTSGRVAGRGFVLQVVPVAAARGYEEALSFTAAYIMQKCATILLLPLDAMEVDGKSVGAHGLDSMIGVELRNWLFTDMKLNIAFQELLASTLTFLALSRLVLAELGIAA